MKLSRLKPLRVVISIVFFVAASVLFLDIRDIGFRFLAREVLYPQVVPSFLSFLKIVTFGATGFIVVLGLTLLFGRVYCSTFCPLGTLQDGIVLLTRKKKRRVRRNYRFTNAKNALRYPILTITVLLFVAGNGLMLNILDPFSGFGRLMSNLFRPIVIALNNLLAVSVEPLGIHAVYRIQWPYVAPVSIGIALALGLLVVILSIKSGRSYCNTVCPVGSLLGLFSRFSLFRLRFNPETCTECGLCEKVCKSSCVNVQEQLVDMSRCVACYNCFTVCPTNAITYEKRWRKPELPENQNENGRRNFIVSSIVCLTGASSIMAQTFQIVQSNPTTIPVPETSPVSPPGSVSLARFTAQCTACHLCVSVCPSGVLTPSFLEYGLSGIMQPLMNFQVAFCDYDCVACLDVCPSGAILPLTVDEKKQTQLGKTAFIKENCVVYTDETDCGACSEHCPTKAVNMVPYPTASNKQLVIPEVTPDICVGCGACEYACPTKPHKAIYVAGNPIHQAAKKPEEEALIKVDTEVDFPF